MDHAEEQAMEIEALQAIFEDSVHVKDGKYLEIVLRPHPAHDPDNPNHVGVVLVVEYTPNYPEQLPLLKLEKEEGLSVDQVEELRKLATATASENIEMAMVYMIAEAIKEWLKQHNVPKLSEYDQMLERDRLRKQAVTGGMRVEDEDEDDESSAEDNVDDTEAPPSTYTPITVENFADWKKAFDEEKRLKREQEKLSNADPELEKRLTGKQYFERHAADFIAAAAQAADEKVFFYDEALYDDESSDNPHSENE